jgi:hypothetical protein
MTEPTNVPAVQLFAKLVALLIALLVSALCRANSLRRQNLLFSVYRALQALTQHSSAKGLRLFGRFPSVIRDSFQRSRCCLISGRA